CSARSLRRSLRAGYRRPKIAPGDFVRETLHVSPQPRERPWCRYIGGNRRDDFRETYTFRRRPGNGPGVVAMAKIVETTFARPYTFRRRPGNGPGVVAMAKIVETIFARPYTFRRRPGN